MISTDCLLEGLDAYGFRFFTGVPCSYLDGPITTLTRRGRSIPAANEGAALAMAAGSCAAGRPAVVFAQNSGFGNLINPLTSLLLPYQLPILTIMSLRGWPDPAADEPQHAVMGATTHALLDTLGIPHWTLTGESGPDDLLSCLARADTELRAGHPAFLLVAKGSLGPVSSERGMPRQATDGSAARGRPTRAETIQAALEHFPQSLVVSTTGYISRGLFAVHDSPQAFYMQGSMGHASAFALGVALASGESRRVLLLDGDGAALMHLGSMATLAAVAPPALTHVLIDNGVYESTGGQLTSVRGVDFGGVGSALGYSYIATCEDLVSLREAFELAALHHGPALIVVRTAADLEAAPPRATSAVSAPVIAARFRHEAAGSYR